MKPQAQPGDLPLENCADEDQAVVFDFVVAYCDDLDAGRRQRLADYLMRFPGHESIIAEEYLRQEDLRGERIPDEAGVGPSDEEGGASESAGDDDVLPVLGPRHQAEPLRVGIEPLQRPGRDLHSLTLGRSLPGSRPRSRAG